MSDLTARATAESRPFARMSVRVRMEKANPAVRATHPYVAAGSAERQVMVVVPVDGDEGKAQHIHEQTWKLRAYGVQAPTIGRAQLESHDRDDHSHDTIREGLEPSRSHFEASRQWLLFAHGHAGFPEASSLLAPSQHPEAAELHPGDCYA